MTMSGAEMKRVTAAVPHEETDFVKAVMEHSDQLYHIAYSYLGNRNDALEALQEATCRAWVKRRTLKDPKGPPGVQILADTDINLCLH
ncbi:RNA polymerase sigma factor [Paenibacillus sp. FSL H8-0259]|uniref:RNA polymerase sigma factor n=1 Tax=Paenibacillus sp. FSL H8-0259 TaxID=1920423 RepID=UPI0021166AD7|nr:sigma factor [Paenibacillus sp. FSL H8-0259]